MQEVGSSRLICDTAKGELQRNVDCRQRRAVYPFGETLCRCTAFIWLWMGTDVGLL